MPKTEKKEGSGKAADVKDDRMHTGIQGLDANMGDGFERNTVNLVRGGAGSCKTLFCIQVLYNGCVAYNEPGIYVSFSESKESVYMSAKSIGCDLAKLEKENKFVFIKYSAEEIDRVINQGGGTIKDLIDSLDAKRLVIDSITPYATLFDTEHEMSEAVLRLYDMLKKWKITSIITEDSEVDVENIPIEKLGFISDSIIHLHHIRKKDASRVRAIEIVKMRHTAYPDKMLPFMIEENGIVVYPDIGVMV